MKKHIRLLKILSIGIVILIAGKCVFAQKPVAKVDINMEGRSETEVNQEGFTPWYIARVASSSITVSGVTFKLTATSPKANTTFRTSWSKAMVQSPYYSRLVNDGVKIDNDCLLNYPGIAAAFEMTISGLPIGKHSLQTYHNIWEDTTKINHAPMNVYLNGQIIHSKIKRSVKVEKNSDATILFTELIVTESNQEIVLLFEADKNFTPSTGKTGDLNVCINAFELNTNDASKQSREPVPSDADLHVDADSGFFILEWKAALNNFTQSHTLYFGTDSATVAEADPTNTTICLGVFPLGTTHYRADGLYNLNTYYWRVDQTDSSNVTTKGKIWRFRPRHLAFPTAEGYGRFATGGRGGKVVYVTNLNADGPGSFKEAVTSKIGPRTVLFNVSGIIRLNDRLVMDDFITVAGQTAPGKGICFRSAPIGVSDECICRFIRMRLGAGATFDGLGMAGIDHGIIDHSSISWTIDEAFSSRGAKNITLQRTLISEALNIAGHTNYPAGSAHGFAASISGDVGSFHHNLLAHCRGRNWSLAGGLDGDGFYAGRLDIFNNVVYNWISRTTDGGAHEVNFVNNYYKKGVASQQNDILNAQLEGMGKGSQSYYYAGNILENRNGNFDCDGSKNDCACTYTLSNSQVLNWDVFVNAPFFPSYAKIESATEANKSVLSDVGCNMPVFDKHDQRVVDETLTGTYTYTGSQSKVGGIIDHEDDAGGYEDYPKESRPEGFDTDLDGLPDWWENLHGSSPNSAKGDFSDSNADPDKDGYTSLEDYLEWMATPHHYLTENVSDTIDLSLLTVGYTNNPVFSIVRSENIIVQLNTSSVIVTPQANKKGISYFQFKVKDAEGDTLIRNIGICIGAKEPQSIKDPTSTGQLFKKNSGLQLKIYPSFFDTQLNIEMYAETSVSITTEINDLNGRVVLHRNFELHAGYNNFQIECPETLSSQLYILKVSDRLSGELLRTGKILRKR